MTVTFFSAHLNRVGSISQICLTAATAGMHHVVGPGLQPQASSEVWGPQARLPLAPPFGVSSNYKGGMLYYWRSLKLFCELPRWCLVAGAWFAPLGSYQSKWMCWEVLAKIHRRGIPNCLLITQAQSPEFSSTVFLSPPPLPLSWPVGFFFL